MTLPIKRSLIKDLIKNLTCSILAVGIILLAMEIPLRIFWYSPPPRPKLKKVAIPSHLTLTDDPILGWRISGKQKDHHSQNTYRILLLGDSFSYGIFGIEEKERFSELLGKMLGDNVEVINAGVTGYGTAQEYLYFVTEGYKYKPNMVILQFFCNDFADNMGVNTPASAKPIYTTNERGQRTPVMITLFRGKLPLSYRLIQKGEPLRVWLNQNSSLYNFLRALYNKMGIISTQTVQHEKEEKIDQELTLELITQLRGKTKSEGVDKFVLAVVPSPFPDLNVYVSALIKFLAAENIPYIYPQEEFVQNKDTLYNIPTGVDGHFSVEGNRRFAEYLYKLIISLEPSLTRPQ